MTTWIQDWLSSPRFERYLNECGGDVDLAFRLYAWNANVASAFLRDLADLEVHVRNAFDRAVTEHWTRSVHWLLDPSSPVLVVKWKEDASDRNHISREAISRAISKAGGLGAASPGKIVAELTFGFWSSLVTKAREHDLWTPYISRAFSPPRPKRSEVDRRMAALNRFRNRVAHHEPLINHDLAAMHLNVLDLCGWMSAEVRTHLEAETRIPSLIEERPQLASR